MIPGLEKFASLFGLGGEVPPAAMSGAGNGQGAHSHASSATQSWLSDPAVIQGLMGLGAGLLGARGTYGSFGAALGQGISGGMQAYRDAQDATSDRDYKEAVRNLNLLQERRQAERLEFERSEASRKSARATQEQAAKEAWLADPTPENEARLRGFQSAGDLLKAQGGGGFDPRSPAGKLLLDRENAERLYGPASSQVRSIDAALSNATRPPMSPEELAHRTFESRQFMEDRYRPRLAAEELGKQGEADAAIRGLTQLRSDLQAASARGAFSPSQTALAAVEGAVPIPTHLTSMVRSEEITRLQTTLESYAGKVRHDRFGGALTPGEAQRFESMLPTSSEIVTSPTNAMAKLEEATRYLQEILGSRRGMQAEQYRVPGASGGSDAPGTPGANAPAPAQPSGDAQWIQVRPGVRKKVRP